MRGLRDEFFRSLPSTNAFKEPMIRDKIMPDFREKRVVLLIKKSIDLGLRSLRRIWSDRQTRSMFRFNGLQMLVEDGVLNPTQFSASKVFAMQVAAWLQGQAGDVLELGCGCGLTSLVVAKHGHDVWAVDIDPSAVKNTWDNARRNDLPIQVICSDWDRELAENRCFDRVICNPPFLPHPTSQLRTALYAGENGHKLKEVIQVFSRRLKPGGKALLMTSSQTDASIWREALEDVPQLEHRFLTAKRHWQERLLFDEFIKR